MRVDLVGDKIIVSPNSHTEYYGLSAFIKENLGKSLEDLIEVDTEEFMLGINE